jgi:hypothetical protein
MATRPTEKEQAMTTTKTTPVTTFMELERRTYENRDSMDTATYQLVLQALRQRSAVVRMREALAQAAQNIRHEMERTARWLERGASVNSLGILQGQGPGLDVKAAQLELMRLELSYTLGALESLDFLNAKTLMNDVAA